MTDHLPPGIDLLWGLRETPNRDGNRAGLRVDRIVAAAIELADADGLGAVSMSRVAQKLGFTTMSLYRHVRSKSELLVLMQDLVFPAPTGDDLARFTEVGWRAGLREWARELLRQLRAHPWWLKIPLYGPPATPNQLGWLDVGLRALADTGLTEQEKVSAMLTIDGYVLGQAWLTTALLTAEQETGVSTAQATAAFGELMTTVVDAQRLPALHRAMAAGAFVDDGDDEIGGTDFAFGLERVLDGIAVLVDERARPPE